MTYNVGPGVVCVTYHCLSVFFSVFKVSDESGTIW